MRVIVLSQHYPPESGGAQNRIHSLVAALISGGHDVVVITAVPNHPDGVVHSGYRGRARFVEMRDGARVVYVWMFTSSTGGALSRVVGYGSYVAMSFVASLSERGPVDVVLGSSPPLTVGIAAWLVARTKRAPYVFDVRDLWPDVAIAMGELRGRFAIRLTRGIERFIYRRAAAITAVTKAFVDVIAGRTDRRKTVMLVRNGSSLVGVASENRAVPLRQEVASDGELLVGYVGQLGLAQSLDHVLDAAETLQDDDVACHFVFVGSGPREAHLRQEVERRGMRNVSMIGRVPQGEAVAWMQACDVLLATLAPDPVYESFVPSKIYDAMALGRPVLLSVPGESRSIVEDAGAGWYYEPGDAHSLVDLVRSLVDHPDVIPPAGEAGRRYAARNVDRAEQGERMERLLVEVAQSHSERG